jgi:hypothetical protein
MSVRRAISMAFDTGGSILASKWSMLTTDYPSANYGSFFCNPLRLEMHAWGMTKREAQEIDP